MTVDPKQTLVQAGGLLRRGDITSAIALLEPACAQNSDSPDALIMLGAAYRLSERWEDAEAAYRRAIAMAPGSARAHNNLADVLRARGEFAAALTSVQQALALDPQNPEALRNCAAIQHALGDFAAAAAVTRTAMQATPDDHRLHLTLARIEHDAGRFKEAATSYAAFLRASPDHAGALTDLGMIYIELNQDELALESFKKALLAAPEHTPAQFGLAQARSNLIPSWHIPMMNEPKRNDAYRAAIREVVKPDDLVLEIGSGAGLLAMLAAEAGAAQVVSCEMVGEVAEEAREIVARNGFADRVSIVPSHSRNLRVGVDLPRRADVLVSEILADDFVGEGALPSLKDAVERLVTPDVRIIPERGAAMGLLVGGEHIAYLLGLDKACGFDVSSFAKFKPWRQAIPGKIPYEAYSDAFPIIQYDFYDVASLEPADKTIEVPILSAGRCYGALQWLRVQLTSNVMYENHPDDTVSVWNKTLYSFPEPVDVRPGDVLSVRVWQDDHYLFVTKG